MEHYFDPSTGTDLKSGYLPRISEFAKQKRIALGGNRLFTAVTQQIATDFSGGYELTTKERAAIQAGVLAGAAALQTATTQSEIVIPRQAVPMPETQQVH